MDTRRLCKLLIYLRTIEIRIIIHWFCISSWWLNPANFYLECSSASAAFRKLQASFLLLGMTIKFPFSAFWTVCTHSKEILYFLTHSRKEYSAHFLFFFVFVSLFPFSFHYHHFKKSKILYWCILPSDSDRHPKRSTSSHIIHLLLWLFPVSLFCVVFSAVSIKRT